MRGWSARWRRCVAQSPGPVSKDREADPMKLIIVAGMIDAKLEAKLAPILAIDGVDRVFLIRRAAFEADKLICHHPPATLRWKPLAELWRLQRLLALSRREHPDTIIAMGLVPHGWYVALAGRLFGIPVIQHAMGKNDFNLPRFHRLGRWLSMAAVRLSARIAVRGSSAADWLTKRGIPRERIFIQHNLHDFDAFAPDPSAPKTFDLIYVGLLARYKRLDLMLAVLARVCRVRPHTRLLLVGDGPLRAQLEAQARELGLERQVEFAGRVPFHSLPRRFNAARTFIMTSDGEGLPQAMIEALSCGLPVIMPRDADIADVARDGVNGLVYPVGDVVACAEAVLRLLDDDVLFLRLRRGALALHGQRAADYGLDKQARNWQQQLLATIERAQPRVLERS